MEDVLPAQIITQSDDVIVATPLLFPGDITQVPQSVLRWITVHNTDGREQLKLISIIPELGVAIEGFGCEINSSVLVHGDNTRVQRHINRKNRVVLLSYLTALNDREVDSNSSLMARFAKISKHSRVDWLMHILSFVSEVASSESEIYSSRDPVCIDRISSLILEGPGNVGSPILENINPNNPFRVDGFPWDKDRYFCRNHQVPTIAECFQSNVERGDGIPVKSQVLTFNDTANGERLFLDLDLSETVGKYLGTVINGEIRLCALLDTMDDVLTQSNHLIALTMTKLNAHSTHGKNLHGYFAASFMGLKFHETLQRLRERGEDEEAKRVEDSSKHVLFNRDGSFHVISRDDKFLYMATQYYEGGDLFQYVTEEGNCGLMNIETIKNIFGQLAKAIYFLHMCCGVAYRDISLEDVLVHNLAEDKITCTVILNSFECCERVPRNPVTNRPCLFVNRRVGKIYYHSIEAIAAEGYLDPYAQDMWALGIVLYIMVTKTPPFNMDNPSKRRFYDSCRNGTLNALPIYFANVRVEGDQVNSTFSDLGVDGAFMDLLSRLLHPDQHERITIEDVLQHEWLQGFAFTPSSTAPSSSSSSSAPTSSSNP